MILTLLSDHSITPKRVSTAKGGEYHSPCPRCGGTDRFHVWPEQYDGQGSFWCRSCDLGGDCIKFLMEYNGLSFRQAAERTGKKLEEQHGSNYSTPRAPKQPQQRASQPRECLPPAEAWQVAARDLLEKSHARLLENPEQLDYLAGRGLPLEAVERYRLGWIGTPEKNCTFSSRKKWGLPRKEGNKKPDALWLPRGIVIPNEFSDRVDSLRIRRPKDDRVPPLQDLSYHVVPGGGTAPLLLHNGQPVIIVVEAQLDGMLCHHAAGDIVGVLALGNSTARPDDRSMTVLKQAKLILIALDFEENNAGGKAWERWHRDFDQVKRWPVPTGKDPGEAYAGGIDICRWIQAGLPEVFRQPKGQQPERPVPNEERIEVPNTEDTKVLSEKRPVPEHAKGTTVNGHSYAVAYRAEDVAQLQQLYPNAVVFSPTEIAELKGMSQENAEKMLLVKKEFGGIIKETKTIEPGQYSNLHAPLPEEPESVQEEMSLR